MQFHFGAPENFFLFLLIPVFLFLFQIHQIRRKKLSRKLICGDFPANLLFFYDSKKNTLKIVLFLTGFSFLILVLARPQGKSESAESSVPVRDTYFILDISGSMLAEDIVPNRLEHAKKLIAEMVSGIDSSRIALILFSGQSKIAVPLTFDRKYFLDRLQNASPNEIDLGGTAISNALELVKSVSDSEETVSERSINVILITDGEEEGNKLPKIAKELAKRKIFVDTVGIGETTGIKIPSQQSPGNFITYNGKEVLSKLNEEKLKEISKITGGIYIPAKRTQINIRNIYEKYIKLRETSKKITKKVQVSREFYQFFLLIGILLLITEYAIREYKN